MTPEVQFKLANLPECPGVYLMKSASGTIIYVGKAINLKNRVRSYFQKNQGHTQKVKVLVQQIADIELLLCTTELEALVLECNLIKKHQPRYNILLKDSKHYPYIRIDVKEPYPRLTMVRSFAQDGAKYFGPYMGGSMLRDVINAIHMVLPLRICTRDMRKPSRPCIQRDMGNCIAPCTGQVPPEEYAALIKQAARFLSGHLDEILKKLDESMLEASKQLQFERAAVFRDRKAAVELVLQRQNAISTGGMDQDIVAMAVDGLDAMVQVLFVRGGKMIGGESCVLSHVGDSSLGETMRSFLLQFYTRSQFIPREILLDNPLEDEQEVIEYLTAKRGKAVHLLYPKRGEKWQLVDMAKRNAADALDKRNKRMEREHARTVGAMEALAQVLGMDALPRRIEGFDISNTQGVESIGSMVVAEDGLAKRKDYRRFKIKTVQGPNDFASMKEVITRRFRRYMNGDPSFSDRPDAVLIDGGQGQLKYALEAIEELGLEDPPVFFGLAEQFEEIWLPNRSEPIRLDKHSDALHLLQRLRDEAHRFAVTNHRALRSKRSLDTRLLNIPGIGKKRAEALLKAFGSVKAIGQASLEEIQGVAGMDSPSARKVFEVLHQEEKLMKIIEGL